MPGNCCDEIRKELPPGSRGPYDDAFILVGIGEVRRFQEVQSLL